MAENSTPEPVPQHRPLTFFPVRNDVTTFERFCNWLVLWGRRITAPTPGSEVLKEWW